MEQVNDLLNKNIENSNLIIQLYKQISILQNEIKMNNSQIWDTCIHSWVRDELAAWDDKCKYVCSKCKLYKNKSYYT
jgi:hypothetical protein